MPQSMLCKLVLLVTLAFLEPGKLQEEQPTPDEGGDAGVAAVFDEIKDLLSIIKSKTGTHIREFRSFRSQIEDDIRSLKDDLTSLNDSVRSLNDSFQEQLLRQQEMATEMAQQQTSLAATQSSLATHTQQVNTTLNSLPTTLSTHIQIFLSMTRSSIAKLVNDKMEKLNSKLDLLNASLFQHREHTDDGLAQLQTSFTSANSKLDTLNATTTQLSTDHQQIQTSILDVECMDMEFGSNLTTKLEVIQQCLECLPTHTCGGTGGWRRVVYLDMTDSNTTCPSGWQLTPLSKRTCGKVSTHGLTCDSVTFSVSGGEYSRVCGRIKAYQYSQTDAFEAYHLGRVTTIDGAYVAGISLTHGSPRQHIWTFAAGASEAEPTWEDACPCDATITIRVPPFVGNDYFCESARNIPGSPGIFYPDDPLWDGQSCISSSTCCSFNTPPYFVKKLPAGTIDDIEARLCRLDEHYSAVEFIELYVQ